MVVCETNNRLVGRLMDGAYNFLWVYHDVSRVYEIVDPKPTKILDANSLEILEMMLARDPEKEKRLKRFIREIDRTIREFDREDISYEYVIERFEAIVTDYISYIDTYIANHKYFHIQARLSRITDVLWYIGIPLVKLCDEVIKQEDSWDGELPEQVFEVCDYFGISGFLEEINGQKDKMTVEKLLRHVKHIYNVRGMALLFSTILELGMAQRWKSLTFEIRNSFESGNFLDKARQLGTYVKVVKARLEEMRLEILWNLEDVRRIGVEIERRLISREERPFVVLIKALSLMFSALYRRNGVDLFKVVRKGCVFRLPAIFF